MAGGEEGGGAPKALSAGELSGAHREIVAFLAPAADVRPVRLSAGDGPWGALRSGDAGSGHRGRFRPRCGFDKGAKVPENLRAPMELGAEEAIRELRMAYAEKLGGALSRFAARVLDDSAPDLEDGRREAHRHAGTAGTYGFAEASEAFRHIEQVLAVALRSRRPLTEEDRKRIRQRLQRAESELELFASTEDISEDEFDDRTVRQPLRAFWVGCLGVLDANVAALAEMQSTAEARSIRVVAAKSWAELSAITDDVDGLVIHESFLSASTPASEILPPALRHMPLAVLADPETDLRAARSKAARSRALRFLEKPLSSDRLLELSDLFRNVAQKSGARVGILDDDPDFVALVSQMLRRNGYEAVPMAPDADPVSVVRDESLQAVLLDLEMPGDSGLDICRMLRSAVECEQLCVLMVTLHDGVDVRRGCFEAGADDYIKKPVVEVELIARLEARLERQRFLLDRLNTDPGTGLMRREAFVRALDARLAEAARGETLITLAILDLDRFNMVNDIHGHLVGDRVLARLGQLLNHQGRASDLRARWGGEEFVIAMPGAPLDVAMRALKRILDAFSAVEFEGARGPFSVTFSAGVAEFPADGLGYEKLLKVADQRLYRAKDRGRNRIEGPSDRSLRSTR